MADLREKAQKLLVLHGGESMLVLPNVWDPIGARVLQKKGYAAVATSSSAISSVLGYHDGEKIRKSTLFDILGRIAGSVTIPVTADIETGYGASLSELEETAQQVIEAGVAGVNIEDGVENGAKLRPLDEQCCRIAVFRQEARRLGVPIVINARIDSFVSPAFSGPGEALEEAVFRAKVYREAGADCVYPMGPGDEATVRILRERIAGPLNILVTPNAAPLAVLQSMGVNRVSFGPFIFRACLRKFVQIAKALQNSGDYSCFGDMMLRSEVAEYLCENED